MPPYVGPQGHMFQDKQQDTWKLEQENKGLHLKPDTLKQKRDQMRALLSPVFLSPKKKSRSSSGS